MVTPNVIQQTSRVNMFLPYAETYHGNDSTGDRHWDGAQGTTGKGHGGDDLECVAGEPLSELEPGALGEKSLQLSPTTTTGGRLPPLPQGAPVGVTLTRARPHPP